MPFTCFSLKAREKHFQRSVLTTELVRQRVSRIVTRALDRLEYRVTGEEQRRLYGICLETLIAVTDEIESKNPVNNKGVKEQVISSVYVSGFDRTLAKTVFGLVFEELRGEVKAENIKEPVVLRSYNKYEEIIKSSIDDFESLFKVELVEYLENIPEYGFASLDVDLGNSGSRLLERNRTEAGESKKIRKKFSVIYDGKLNEFSNLISTFSSDINPIISDSYAEDFKVPSEIDSDLLTATFAGGGKKLYDDIIKLFNIAAEFGGYQGSYSGNIEYQSIYYEYLMALSYGRVLPLGILTGEFGDFGSIYGVLVGEEIGVPGLKFLEQLYRTRSANQSTESTKPVALKYSRDGITDRYKDRIVNTRVDFASLTLESLYIKSLEIGDIIKSLLIRKPQKIGHTELHLQMLSKVFPPSSNFIGRNSGVTGGIFTFLRGHRRLYSLLGNRKTGVYGISGILRTLDSSVEGLASTMKELGFRPGGFVPSLELNYHEPRKSEVRKKLGRVGFTGSEVDEIMSSRDFSELIQKSSPITDSSDVISFFRAFDLTKLIYEFGGDKGINEYIDFLYGKDPDGSLVRLLSLLGTNRTQSSIVIGSRYSKLIGYLITLTYAIDPEKLSTFNQFLARNNLNLLESISLLIEEGRESLVKNRSEVSVLSGVVAQMVVSDSSGYRDQKPLWDKLVSDSSGNATVDIYSELEGITPTELNKLLNNPSATSPIGEMLNGVRGGRLTSLLRYSNLFGLLYSLSDFRNSHQLINNQAEDYTKLLDLISALDSFSEYLNLAVIVFENFDLITEKSEIRDDLIRIQNKKFPSFSAFIRGEGAGGEIAESPGIGNSRIPNGVRIQNSLRPEEAALVSVRGQRLGIFPQSGSEEGSYVRIAASNLLSQGIVLPEISSSTTGSIENSLVPLSDRTTSYEPISSNQLGGSILNTATFDPVESCKKFGGTNCDDLGYAVEDMCQYGFNKALYPEIGYGPDLETPRVPVDRALGEKMTGSVKEVKIPPNNTNYYFSGQGITELSRTQTLKESEMLCASLQDPFEYSACITMMKCKKFDPPYKGKYFFPFCPKTMFGGRLGP
jgi:hypothetical protein